MKINLIFKKATIQTLDIGIIQENRQLLGNSIATDSTRKLEI